MIQSNTYTQACTLHIHTQDKSLASKGGGLPAAAGVICYNTAALMSSLTEKAAYTDEEPDIQYGLKNFYNCSEIFSGPI